MIFLQIEDPLKSSNYPDNEVINISTNNMK